VKDHDPLLSSRRGPFGLLEARPPVVWSAALFYLFAGLTALATVAFPLSAEEPLRMVFSVGVGAVTVAAGLWIAGRRVPGQVLQLLMAIATLGVSFVVANGKTGAGVMLAAFAYPWIAVYVAHFFTRQVIFAQTLLISAGFGAGLLRDGLPNMFFEWVMVTATVCSTSLLLGHLSEALRHEADTDQLTGLLNRNGFHTAAVRERAIADRSGNPLTLVALDLDGFKLINDTYGHAAGDRILMDLGEHWRVRLRTGDILARHGGDEFVLLLPATPVSEASAVLQRLHVPEVAVGWSVGVSEWQRGESLDACMARADAELYSVKASRNLTPRGEVSLASSLLPST
jgi:diguanylate cyclase (GGDEF)-like protein